MDTRTNIKRDHLRTIGILITVISIGVALYIHFKSEKRDEIYRLKLAGQALDLLNQESVIRDGEIRIQQIRQDRDQVKSERDQSYQVQDSLRLQTRIDKAQIAELIKANEALPDYAEFNNADPLQFFDTWSQTDQPGSDSLASRPVEQFQKANAIYQRQGLDIEQKREIIERQDHAIRNQDLALDECEWQREIHRSEVETYESEISEMFKINKAEKRKTRIAGGIAILLLTIQIFK